MTASADRSIEYLHGWRFLVVSDGTVGSSATSVLAALGASVTRLPTVADAGDPSEISAYDGVICDQVRSGADEHYLESIARWQQLDTDRPRAWVTVSAFGLDGPARDYLGSNLVCSAAGGLLAAVSDPSGELYEMPGEQALQAVGQLAALAALHGVSISRTDAVPVHQELSAQEAIAFSTIQQDLNHLLGRGGGGSSSPRYAAPMGVFQCSDGPIRIYVLDNHQFLRFSEVINRPDWVAKYPNTPDRVANYEEIEAFVREWTGGQTFDECERVLQGGGISATAIRPMSELADSAQFRARAWPDQTTFADTSTALLPALVERRNAVSPRAESTVRPNRRLNELHVVEVTNVLAGPLAGATLGAMGADVVRLEDKDRLDIYRGNGPFVDGVRDIERAAYFLGANHTKRSVGGGADTPDDVPGRAMAWGHVMIENVGASRLNRLGLATQAVGGADPGLAISISGYGRTGPCAHYRGYATNVHAFAGFEDAIVQVAGPDATIRTSLADYFVAIWSATLAAAWWLGGSTDDHRLDLSMAEVMAARLTGLLAGGADQAARDTNLIVALGDGRRLTVTLGPGDGPQRVLEALRSAGLDQHGPSDDVVEALRAAADRDVEATVRALQGAGIAAYVARTTTTVITDDQLRAREFFLALDHPVAGPIDVLTLPWKTAGSTRSGYRPAPLFAADDAWAQQAFPTV